jgi:hypothetical protein
MDSDAVPEDSASEATRVLSWRQQNHGHGQYDAGMQPPPPASSPQWGSSPHDPPSRGEPGYGGRPAGGSHGQPGPGYGGQPTPGSYGQAAAPGYGQQPPYAAYSSPPPFDGPPIQPGPGVAQNGYGQQLGYGPPGWGGYSSPVSGPSSQQLISWIILGVIGLLGLLSAILTLTLWLNLSSAASHASDLCNRFGGEYSSLCRQSIKNVVPSVPTALVIYLILVIFGSLLAASGAALLFLQKQAGRFLILGGGLVMLACAIVCEARYSATGRITYDLIAGLLIAVAGGLMFVPAFRTTLGLGSMSTGGGGLGQFQGGGQSPYGQPQLPQYGPPGSGGYPPSQWWGR